MTVIFILQMRKLRTLCELYEATLRKLFQASSDLSPSRHFPLLAQKRVWVGDTVLEGKGAH